MAEITTGRGGAGLGWIYMGSHTPTSGTEFVVTLNDGYPIYHILWAGVRSNADDQYGAARFITGGIAQTAADEYNSLFMGVENDGDVPAALVVGDPTGVIAGGADEWFWTGHEQAAANPGTTAEEESSGDMFIYNLNSALRTRVVGHGTHTAQADGMNHVFTFMASANVAEESTGIELGWEGSTQFASGTFYWLGLNAGTSDSGVG